MTTAGFEIEILRTPDFPELLCLEVAQALEATQFFRVVSVGKNLQNLDAPNEGLDYTSTIEYLRTLCEGMPETISLVLTDWPIGNEETARAFGLAVPNGNSGGAAIVSSFRLVPRSERHENHELSSRILKECVHEIGHVLGLGHCSNRFCAMSYSSTIAEVDLKDSLYCPMCLLRLTVSKWKRSRGGAREVY